MLTGPNLIVAACVVSGIIHAFTTENFSFQNVLNKLKIQATDQIQFGDILKEVSAKDLEKYASQLNHRSFSDFYFFSNYYLPRLCIYNQSGW